MHRNIRDARFHYPGWCVRVHVHELAPKSLYQPLVNDGAQVFMMDDADGFDGEDKDDFDNDAASVAP